MSVRGSLKQAVRAIRAGDPAAALPHLRKAVGAAPDDPRNALLFANALSGAGEFDEAEPRYRTAIDARPKTAAFRAFYARSLFDRGRFDDAVREADAALAIEPGHVLAHVAHGLARLAAGDAPKGIEELDRFGFADEPDLAGRLLVLLESDGRLPDLYHPPIPVGAEVGTIPAPPAAASAPGDLDDLGRWRAFCVRRRFYAGLALRRRYRMADALAAWQEVLRAVPGEPDTLIEVAATYYLVGDFPAALAVLDQLSGEDADDPDARALRGLALYASGRVGEAEPLVLAAIGESKDVEATDEPVDLAPAGMALYYAGRIALAAGDRVAARLRFSRIPPLDPLLVMTRWESFKVKRRPA